jgi:hypothetical protein
LVTLDLPLCKFATWPFLAHLLRFQLILWTEKQGFYVIGFTQLKKEVLKKSARFESLKVVCLNIPFLSRGVHYLILFWFETDKSFENSDSITGNLDVNIYFLTFCLICAKYCEQLSILLIKKRTET